MAFMLGAFTNGLVGGAKDALKMYKDYEDIKQETAPADAINDARAKDNAAITAAPAGAQPGQATAAIQTGTDGAPDSNFLGNAQSDSAASAPKPAPDLNADPRKPALTSGQRAALYAAGAGLGAFGNAKSDSAMSAPGTSAQQPDRQLGVEGNPMGEPFSWPPTVTAPQATAPAQALQMSGSTGTPSSGSSSRLFGSSVADWLFGRSPPQYLPPQNQPGQATPQPGQPANVGVRPPMLSGAPAAGSPTLANQQSPMGQAIQTQYGNGGM